MEAAIPTAKPVIFIKVKTLLLERFLQAILKLRTILFVGGQNIGVLN
jgi:hypothetical protein